MTPAALAETLALLLSDADNLGHAARAARSIARPDAAANLADLVEALVSQEARP